MRNDSDCFLDKSTSQFNVYAASAASQHDSFVHSGSYAICLGLHNIQGSGQDGFLTWARVYPYIQNHPFDATAKYRKHTEKANNVTA
jgi:hypothetical protein